MEPVVITISHRLGKDEVIRRLKPALSQAAQSFPVIAVEEETWTGDRLDFRVKALGNSIIGNVEVFENFVRLEAQLPWLLARFADGVRRVIETRGRILLDHKR